MLSEHLPKLVMAPLKGATGSTVKNMGHKLEIFRECF